MRRRLDTPFVRLALGLTCAGVTAFHLQLLWSRLADGSVLDPLVALRWLGAAAMGLFIVRYRYLGISLLRGRSALILWLLVALLHGFGLVPAADAMAGGATPAEVALIATPLGVAVAAFLWAGATCLRRSGKELFALLARRGPALDRVAGLGLARLAAAGPRAPPS